MNQDRLIAKQKLMAVPNVFRRKPLAAAILAASLAGCSSDDSNNFTFEPQPTFNVSNPRSAIVSTLSDNIQFDLTMIAQDTRLGFVTGPELLVNSVSASRDARFIDATGNIIDSSGNALSFGFSEMAKGNGDNFFSQTLSGEFLPGLNILRFNAIFGEGQIVSDRVDVISGSNWMKETALAYDASGNLYSLSRLNNPTEPFDPNLPVPAIFVIDVNTGIKQNVEDLDGLGGIIEDPVDFIIRGGTAYVLDNGSAAIYSVANFAEDIAASGTTTDVSQSCVGEAALIDPVAFDIDFDPSGNPQRYFVADRGLKEIVEIDVAGGDCLFIATPEDVVDVDDPASSDSEDTVSIDVPGLKLNLPVDIAHDNRGTADPADDRLFLTGGWLDFTLSNSEFITDASGNPVDASGDPADDLSQALQQDNIVATPANGLVAVSLATGDRQFVEFAALQRDASGNLLVDENDAAILGEQSFAVIDGAQLAVGDGELFVVEEFVDGFGIPRIGILSIDLAINDASGNFVASHVTGEVFVADTDTGTAAFLPDPDTSIPLAPLTSIAIDRDGDELSALSIVLGSYINVDLSAPSPECVPFDFSDGADNSNDENIATQCVFDGTRTLVPGGVTVAGVNPDEGDLDDGYEISARASTSFSGLRRFTSPVYVREMFTGVSLLAWNHNEGAPSQNLVDSTFNVVDGDQDLRLDELLVAEGRALTMSGNTIFTVDNDNDRLLGFSSSMRILVSESGAGPAFIDPLASFVREPLEREDSDPDNPVVNASRPLSYYVLDRALGDLVRVSLGSVFNDSMVGERELVSSAGCDLASATALAHVQDFSTETLPADLDGNGLATDSFDDLGNPVFFDASGNPIPDASGNQPTVSRQESEDNRALFEEFSSVFVAADQDLLRINFLDNSSCGAALSGAFNPNANIVALDTQYTEELVRDASGNIIEDASGNTVIAMREVSLMALDAGNMQLVEIDCTQEDMPDASVSCTRTGVYDFAENQPISPAAMTMDRVTREATIFDDVLNSFFTVDLAPRNAEGVPVQLDDPSAIITGQTLINLRDLPLNCDPADDPEGCRNL